MDNFKIIYKILKAMEVAMDLEEFDTKSISKEAFGLQKQDGVELLQCLQMKAI